MTKSKRCSKCGETKPIDGFSWKVKAKGYRQSKCKPCQVVESAAWAAAHPESVRAASRRQVESGYVARYREQNRELMRSRNAAFYAANPEWNAAKHARRREQASLQVDAMDRALSIEWRKAIKNAPCFYCGERQEVMHDDHVRPLAKGGTDHWWNLARACASCNHRKGTKSADQFLNELAGMEALNG